MKVGVKSDGLASDLQLTLDGSADDETGGAFFFLAAGGEREAQPLVEPHRDGRFTLDGLLGEVVRWGSFHFIDLHRSPLVRKKS